MLRIVVGAILLSLPLAASAQTFSRTRTTVSGYSYQTLETSNVNLGSTAPSTRDGSPNSTQCLARKKTGKIECHTYAEWVEIARAIEANRQ